MTAQGGPRRGLQLRGHEGELTAAAFCPTAYLLATGSEDKTICLWDLTNLVRRPPVVLPAHNDTVTALAFTPNGQGLASAAADGVVRLWDLSFKRPIQRGRALELGVKVNSLAFAPDGQTLICGLEDHSIRLLEVSTLQPRPRSRVQEATAVLSVAVSAKGMFLASGSAGGTVRIWDLANGQARERVTPRGHTGAVHALAFSRDGQLLVSGSDDQTVRLWELHGPEPQERAVLPAQGAIHFVALSLDGKRLAAGSQQDAQVRLWDLPATVPRVWSIAPEPEAHSGPVAFVDNQTLATGSWDGAGMAAVRLWDVKPGEPIAGHVFPGQRGPITSLLYCSGCQALVSTSNGDEPSVRIWDPITNRELHRFSGSEDGKVSAGVLAPDGGLLAFGNADKGKGRFEEPHFAVWLWDLKGAAPKRLPVLPGHAGPVRGIAFTPDSQRLATADEEGRLVWWDLEAKRNLQDWRLPGRIHAVAFAPDGRHLAVANGNGTIYILRLKALASRP